MYHPIFILGVTQRSGTNYLWDLIRRHSVFRSPSTIWEDYLVAHSDQLLAYVDRVYQRWNWKSGVPDPDFKRRMAACLGDGLIRFLSTDAESTRFVTKTPDVSLIENFFDLFPNAYLLVLVRDGRAVAESRVKSFGDSYDVAIRKWAAAAREILAFTKKMQASPHRFLLVRYEDLWTDFEAELRRIFTFCDLDPDGYDYRSAKDQPVRGSSAYRGEGEAELHWDPVPKPADFNPTDRWKHWGRRTHALFNAVAGTELEAFGYRREPDGRNRAARYFGSRILRIRSLCRYGLDAAWKRTRRSLRRIAGERNIQRLRRLVPNEKQ